MATDEQLWQERGNSVYRWEDEIGIDEPWFRRAFRIAMLSPGVFGWSRNGVVRGLLSDDPAFRRHTRRKVMEQFRRNPDRHSRDVARLEKAVHIRHPNLEEWSQRRTQASPHPVLIGIYCGTLPDEIRMRSASPTFRRISDLLQTIEYSMQLSRFIGYCTKCSQESIVKYEGAVTRSRICEACGVPIVRWLFRLDGYPVLYMVDDFAFKIDGSCFGKLEGNEIWSTLFHGEIVEDDRVAVTSRFGHQRKRKVSVTPRVKPNAQPPVRHRISSMLVKSMGYGEVNEAMS